MTTSRPWQDYFKYFKTTKRQLQLTTNLETTQCTQPKLIICYLDTFEGHYINFEDASKIMFIVFRRYSDIVQGILKIPESFLHKWLALEIKYIESVLR